MSAEKDVTESFPSPKDFFLKIPLYKSYSKAKDFDSKEAYCSYIFNNYRDFKGTMDCFCIECKRQNTFLSNQSIVHDGYTTDSTTTRSYKIPEYEDFTVKFGCVRDLNHMLTFVFRFHDDTLTKIGQYPSLADLATSEIEKYRSILANNDYRELSKAVGLTAHGVGIGAFVYLRRIFERLIEEAHQEAIKIAGWDEDTYSKSRMDEKIPLLKYFLPSFLIDNRIMYSILSKGIHELSEEECLEAFNVVKLGIELILDEKIGKKEKERKISNITKEIQKAYESLKGSENKS